MSEGRVDVWTFEFAALEDAQPVLMAVLTAAEHERAGRLAPGRQAQFALTRAALRLLLGERLGAEPAAIELVEGAGGKPQLAGPSERARSHFNVSHSRGLGAVALADRPVGVDVEHVRPRRHLDGIAGRILSDAELREYRALDDAARLEHFFAAWTTKEALAKGLGRGLAFVLAREARPGDWSVAPLPLPEAYRGAVAAPGKWSLATSLFSARTALAMAAARGYVPAPTNKEVGE